MASFIGNYNLLDGEQASTLFGPVFRASWRCDRSPSPCCGTGARSDEPHLPGVISGQQLLGNVIRYQVSCAAGLLTVDCLNRCAGDLLAVGSAVTLVVAGISSVR